MQHFMKHNLILMVLYHRRAIEYQRNTVGGKTMRERRKYKCAPKHPLREVTVLIREVIACVCFFDTRLFCFSSTATRLNRFSINLAFD
jgi:hypothetical protein